MMAIKYRILHILFARKIQRLKRERTALRAKCEQLRAQHRAVRKRQKQLERVTLELLLLRAL